MEKFSIGTLIRKTVASVFFLGYLPASGTVGSLVTVAALYYVDMRTSFFHQPQTPLWYWGIILFMTAFSFFFASRSRETFGKEDSGRIIIDEVAGQLITFMFIPISINTLIAGFFLFRFFDIVKPYPVHFMEEMEEGVGVTMDDVAAGVMANISLILILAGYHAVKSFIN